MREWVFKRITLIKNLIVYNAQITLAYRTDFLASVFSTFFYTFVYVLLIEVIYTNTDSLGGYSEDQMKVFFLLGQIQIFLFFAVINGIQQLLKDIYDGSLDLILTKPVPHMFYYRYGFIEPVSWFRSALPPIVFIIITINWSNIVVLSEDVIAACFIFVVGFITLINIQTMIAFIAFYLKNSKILSMLMFDIFHSVNATVPLDLLPSTVQRVFLYIIPVGFVAGLSTVILFNKAEPWIFIPVVVFFMILSELLKTKLWNLSVKHYTSASS